MLYGICDAFDGTIARRINKKNDDKYGVYLDSLADIIGSGILPISICLAMNYNSLLNVLIYSLFIICAVTRLAYYNNFADKDYFIGLPVTCSAILIPICTIIKNEIVLMSVILILSCAYVINIKIKKPSFKLKIILSIIAIIVSVLIVVRQIYYT